MDYEVMLSTYGSEMLFVLEDRRFRMLAEWAFLVQ